jgi:anaerobic magnesium-protoporphyrin IX monomethyl ester cyclase
VRILFFYRGAESFGIEYLSAVLTQAGHHTELIYDPGLDNNFYVSSSLLKRLNVPKKLVRKAKDFSPDLVAFSSITNLYPYVKDMARALKAELKVPTVIGGIHPTVLPELVLQEDCFDIVCRGEGEYALLELANRLERGEDIADIENLWVKDSQGVIRENEQRPLIQDLDALPFPDKALFYRNGAFWRNVSIMTGRGCPYHCTFCVNSFYHQMNTRRGGMVRRRSVDNVIQELTLYKQKYRPQTVNFQDDTFSVEIDWLEELRTNMRRRSIYRFSATCTL